MTNALTRAAAARARDAETRPPLIAYFPCGAQQLLQGWPLYGEPSEDLVAWCKEVLAFQGPPLPTAVHSAFTEARDRPTVENAVALADCLDVASTSRQRHILDMGRLGNLADRARISAAILGDPHSCMTASFEAGMMALSAGSDHEILRYAVSERWLANLAAAYSAGAEPMHADRLRALRAVAMEEVLTLASVVVLFQSGHGSVRDDTGWLPDDDEPWGEPPQEPGIVVLRSGEHLPGTAKDGSRPGSATTPRAEAAPIAGVRLPCRPVPDLVEAKRDLVEAFPYAGDLLDQILGGLVGRPYAKLAPILLVGPPGCGKTRLATSIASVLDLPSTVYSCSGVTDSAFIGTSRQWSTGRTSVPLQAIRREMLATVCVILDEIEKTGEGRQNGSLHDGILPMLDHSERYHDPYFECTTDLSGVTFLATANRMDGIPSALRDRFRIFRMLEPRRQHLPALARGLLSDMRVERGTEEAWLPDLDSDELAIVARHWPGGSVRRLRRLLETIIAGRETLAARH